jgi:RNA polymerase sigma-70 factor (ECF subfamily)
MLHGESEDGATVAAGPYEASAETFERLDVVLPEQEAKEDRHAADARLVRAACGGDRNAMAELHQRYAPMIHGILLARVAAREADDLTQDVFVHAIAKLPSLRDPRRFAGWLAMIARNAATDHHRRTRPQVQLDEERSQGSDGEQAERRLRALEVLDTIMKLPLAYREVLVLRLAEGMTGPEIATRTGLTAGSVRVNLHRGMKLLREKLDAAVTPGTSEESA